MQSSEALNIGYPCFINASALILPNEPVSNERMADYLGHCDDRQSERIRGIILRSNGIKYRYYALDSHTKMPTHSNAELTALAVNQLLNERGINSDGVDGLYCGTSSPDLLIPGHGQMVHAETRLPICDVASFAGVCASSVAALNYGRMRIQLGTAKKVVVTGSETASHLLRLRETKSEISSEVNTESKLLAFDTEFIRWMLSDGAAALLLSSEVMSHTTNYKIEWIESLSFANELPTCMSLGGFPEADQILKSWKHCEESNLRRALSLRQDVRLLDKNILDVVVDGGMGRLIDKYGVTPNQIDYFLPHISSEYFRPKLMKKLVDFGFEIDASKWFSNLTRIGNIGSAALFAALHEMDRELKPKPGSKILCLVPESARFSLSFIYLTVY